MVNINGHNGVLDCGRTPDWACHFISHILGGFTNLAHGATLSILTPHWMEYVYHANVEKFAQFAVRVWDIEYDEKAPEKTALGGIEALRTFWKGLGVPLTLTEAGVNCDQLEKIAELVVEDGPVGNVRKLYKEDVLNILKACV
ncbi:MAG: iron-containing alcohol dehydrogenase [Lachnospiraceae bacterium]|nr:iron-containing alcohol dehydrogenase [Lachnospiraceae bacterium]